MTSLQSGAGASRRAPTSPPTSTRLHGIIPCAVVGNEGGGQSAGAVRATYCEAYNGGRAGFGRRVRSPAGIDLSDGACAALGMTQSDWVTVTFLWLAPSS